MNDNTEDRPNKNGINALSDKEWLDLSWKYFQQHAQQRVSYFNFFVVFSTILTTGYISTFQNSYGFPAISLGIGIIQLFIAFIFTKLDARNSYLVKHAEDTIKKIEAVHASAIAVPLFTTEEAKSLYLKEASRKKFILLQPFTHGKSFRWIYTFFVVISLVELILSITLLFADNTKVNPKMYNIQLFYDRSQRLKDNKPAADTLQLILRSTDSAVQKK